MMLSIPPKQGRIYKYIGRHCHLLAILSKLLIGNGYRTVDYIKPDRDTDSISLVINIELILCSYLLSNIYLL